MTGESRGSGACSLLACYEKTAIFVACPCRCGSGHRPWRISVHTSVRRSIFSATIRVARCFFRAAKCFSVCFSRVLADLRLAETASHAADRLMSRCSRSISTTRPAGPSFLLLVGLSLSDFAHRKADAPLPAFRSAKEPARAEPADRSRPPCYFKYADLILVSAVAGLIDRTLTPPGHFPARRHLVLHVPVDELRDRPVPPAR